MNVYEQCPVVSCEHYLLRLVSKDDCADLLRVYSDPKAVPLFNSDNCNGDDFYYQTAERMAQAIDFWLFSFEHHYFVRWSVIDRRTGEAIGTIELFRRVAEDAFNSTALLRLDLRSDYEHEKALVELLFLIRKHVFDWFECDSITTKAVPLAKVRRKVLSQMGFSESDEALKGHDGTGYGSYWVYRKHA